MVVETKESKDKEISELKAKIQDYEEKLFVVSKQNNEVVIRELMEFTNMTFHEINQTIKSHQTQKLKYSDLLNRYNEFEAKYKQSEIFYKNQIEDLKSSITEQVEENTDKLNAEHNAEVKILKNEILTCKLEMEELHQKKIYQVSELEKRVLELDATINIIKRQEDLVKTLEHSIEAKDLKIKNNEREVSRLNQRIEDLLAQIKKLKSTINSSETHAKF